MLKIDLKENKSNRIKDLVRKDPVGQFAIGKFTIWTNVQYYWSKVSTYKGPSAKVTVTRSIQAGRCLQLARFSRQIQPPDRTQIVE